MDYVPKMLRKTVNTPFASKTSPRPIPAHRKIFFAIAIRFGSPPAVRKRAAPIIIMMGAIRRPIKKIQLPRLSKIPIIPLNEKSWVGVGGG